MPQGALQGGALKQTCQRAFEHTVRASHQVQWVFAGLTQADGRFVPYGDINLFHRVTSGAILAGWIIERTSDVVVVRGSAVPRWWRRHKMSESGCALTAEQQKVLQQLRELREDDLKPLIHEWRQGFLEPRDWEKAKRRERRLLRKAARVNLQSHPEVREELLTMQAFGVRSALRGTGLTNGLRGPFMARAAPGRLRRVEAQEDIVCLFRDHTDWSLRRIHEVMCGLGQEKMQWSAFYKRLQRRDLFRN